MPKTCQLVPAATTCIEASLSNEAPLSNEEGQLIFENEEHKRTVINKSDSNSCVIKIVSQVMM
jgi:hypothetical protein